MSSQSRPALPINSYRSRTAVKESACFVCGRFTRNVFVADQGPVSDWFYVCSDHTRSPSFCSAVRDQPAQELPADGAGRSDSKPSIDRDGADTKSKDAAEPSGNAATAKAAGSNAALDASAGSNKPSAPAEKYTLNRDVFYLRIRPFVQQFERQQSSQLMQRLPSAPKNLPK